MKTLAIIREHEVYVERESASDTSYAYSRNAVRMFLFDKNDHVAVLYYPPRDGETVSGDYLLVGGGIEDGETFEEALTREAREEAGCEVHLIEELGHVKQYGVGEEKRLQDEYFYKARVKGEKGKTSFDERERGDSAELRWVPLEDLVQALKQQRPSFGRTNSLLVYEEFFGSK